MTFHIDSMHKTYAKFTLYNIFTLSDFILKKDLFPDCPEIAAMTRKLPPQWLAVCPLSVDLKHTLYEGVVRQAWSVRAIYGYLRDSETTPPTAI